MRRPPAGRSSPTSSSRRPSGVTLVELSALELFRGLPADELEYFIELCTATEFDRGEPIYREGEAACDSLLIVDGVASVDTVARGRRLKLNSVQAGDLIGESGLIVQSEPRSANVTASGRVRGLVLTRTVLRQLEGTAVLATLQMTMLEATARRLRRTQRSMTRLVVQRAASSATPSPVDKPAPRPGMWRSFLQALGGLA